MCGAGRENEWMCRQLAPSPPGCGQSESRSLRADGCTRHGQPCVPEPAAEMSPCGQWAQSRGGLQRWMLQQRTFTREKVLQTPGETMQLMLWVKGLLSQLLVFIPLTRELRFHPKQESFVRQLSSYEITSPRRLNDFGEAFPHTHHFRRRKRSPDSEPWASRTHYQLHAFGQLYRLNLSAQSDFIAAAYRVRHLGRAEAGSPHPDSDLKHCFYSGHVNSEMRHTVVVSLCTGIMGTFQTSDGQYFLEPLMKPDGGQYEDEHNKPHLIYKHGALNSNPLGKTSHPCATFERDFGPSRLSNKSSNCTLQVFQYSNCKKHIPLPTLINSYLPGHKLREINKTS
ncbi:hypothetical protein chiPu_0005168 [Chiloscyllium punctatum]|uniref:Peptidase M12B propeptide domain-containing protein n=1 Tax=Chiloscyllium punctatum TaxID=137246 RepID=A0A401S8L3_CHIPU|nr:hypothetical protein [Chiloscyllium punctatum]